MFRLMSRPEVYEDRIDSRKRGVKQTVAQRRLPTCRLVRFVFTFAMKCAQIVPV